MISFKRVRAAGGVAALALAVTALVGCSSSEAAPPSDEVGADEVLPIRVGYSQGPSTLPIIIAEKNGIFADHGLDFTGTIVTPGPTAMQGLGKQYDVLQTSTQAVFEAADQGLDIAFVTGMGNSTTELPAFPVYVGDASISTWGDLGGKVFGVPSLTGFATTTALFLAEKEGADPASIETPVVPWDTQADQLAAGQVDAVWTVIPYSFLMNSKGFTLLGDPTLQATGVDELVASVTAAPGDFAEKNPETLSRFKAALEEAAQWVADNEDEAKQVVVDVLGLPEQLIMSNPMQSYKIDLAPADLEPMFVVYDQLDMLQDLPELDELFAKF
ncbi:ABC transporter substrate-binding protein [Microbacterium fluvii]|uniref:ABC transporter substrate-binding protein n=2 Tax=Microbacterium fluvii TaxID=415215 RepID=A0ABW2H930_9MICO|nr:ABC transporter substrate-binding protein [Microbacterium fluvii]MCU4671157.1 ABC transporter substrate-binding protein [Microbacterium fluvii]